MKSRKKRIFKPKDRIFVFLGIILLVIGLAIMVFSEYSRYIGMISEDWPKVKVVDYTVITQYGRPRYSRSGTNTKATQSGMHIHQISYKCNDQKICYEELGMFEKNFDLSRLRCNPNTGELYIRAPGHADTGFGAFFGILLLATGIAIVMSKVRK